LQWDAVRALAPQGYHHSPNRSEPLAATVFEAWPSRIGVEQPKEAYMADPVTLGVIITGLVGAYKAAVVKAGEKQAAPAKRAEVAKGEQAAPLVKAIMQQHGDAAEDNF
jgi:hypothetical protein